MGAPLRSDVLRRHAGDGTPLPLYLRGQAATCVDADGPSLLVRRAGHAPDRYPVARLSRVIASQRVEWSGAALRLCMTAKIPIVVLDGDGEPLGYVQPARVARSSLDRLLREALDRPDWPERYENFVRAQRMRLVRQWIEGLQARGVPLDVRVLRERVRADVFRWRQPDRPAAPGRELWQGALAAFASRQALCAGVSLRYWGCGGGCLDLAGDMAALLGLSLELELSGAGEAAHGDPVAMLRVLHAFGERTAATAREFLGRMHGWARRTVEEWR